jgi:predicted transcriptional regulator
VNTEKINPRLTATTVKGYIRHQTVGLNQLSDLITSVHQVLAQLGQPPEPDDPSIGITWCALIAATGEKRCGGTLAPGTD